MEGVNMWLQDKYGNSINSNQLMSLYVYEDSGSYVVAGNNSVNTNVAEFQTTESMTEPEAESLLATLSSLLGIYVP
jgi:hypothetical protein